MKEYVTLFNSCNFPFACFAASPEEIGEQMDLISWVVDKGYDHPCFVNINSKPFYNMSPNHEYYGSVTKQGEPIAHIYRNKKENCYTSHLQDGGAIVASDLLELNVKLNRYSTSYRR